MTQPHSVFFHFSPEPQPHHLESCSRSTSLLTLLSTWILLSINLDNIHSLLPVSLVPTFVFCQSSFDFFLLQLYLVIVTMFKIPTFTFIFIIYTTSLQGELFSFLYKFCSIGRYIFFDLSFVFEIELKVPLKMQWSQYYAPNIKSFSISNS